MGAVDGNVVTLHMEDNAVHDRNSNGHLLGLKANSGDVATKGTDFMRNLQLCNTCTCILWTLVYKYNTNEVK